MVRPYTVEQPFRFWCQKILPLVYDDSLSYYELLNKVVDYLNKNVDNVNALGEAFNNLQKYVQDYFTNLDVQQEIDAKLDAMVEDGTMDELIQPLVGDAVSEWLEDNVTPTGSAVVVDASLTISGAAADAKVTGDEISDLKSDFNLYDAMDGYLLSAFPGNFAIGGLNPDGTLMPSQRYRVSSSAPITLDYDVSIKPLDGFRFGWVEIADGSTPWRGWYEDERTISAGTTFSLQLARVSEITSEVANVSEFTSSFIIKGKLIDYVEENRIIANNNENLILNGYYNIEQTDIERGAYEANGKVWSDIRLRTKNAILMQAGEEIEIADMGDLYVNIVSYPTETLTGGVSLIAWTNTPQVIKITTDCYIAFNFANAQTYGQSTNIVVTDFVGVDVRIYNTYATRITHKVQYMYSYTGEKFNPVLGFNSSHLMSISYSGSSYTLNDIATYGDYILFFLNPGTVHIYQLSTKTKVGEVVVGTQHFACAMFSDTFYDSSDPFPLLYADTTSDGIYNVIRFTSLTSAEIIKNYKFDTALYGSAPQVSFDFANNKAYCVADDVTTSNKYKLFTFDMTSETENQDGSFSFAEISSGTFPFYQTRQGNTFFNNRMFMAFANTSSPANPKIVSFDCSSGNAVIASEFNTLPFTGEAEGLTIAQINGEYCILVTDYYNVYKLSF